MQRAKSNDAKQPGSIFTIMNNIRDYCEQSDPKKNMLFTFATYCDREGICYPSNETLSRVTRKSRRTVQRMLKDLAVDGDLEILECGRGRNQKRIIRLTRYAVRKGDKTVSRKRDTAMTRLNVTRSVGKTCCNNHDNCQEQPPDATKSCNRVANFSANRVTESEKRFGKAYQNQNTPAQGHVKWAEFSAWCRSKGGQPREDGFWKWLCGQKPQWRKARQDFKETGYVLDGKFLTCDEANRRGITNPGLLTKFKAAVKRGDTVQLLVRNGR